jgi:hypothetical protein
LNVVEWRFCWGICVFWCANRGELHGECGAFVVNCVAAGYIKKLAKNAPAFSGFFEELYFRNK